MNFIKKATENWKVELAVGANQQWRCHEVSSKKTLTPLLFVTVMIPFNNILRKCTERYKSSKSSEKHQPPYVHGWYKDICQRRTGALDTHNNDI